MDIVKHTPTQVPAFVKTVGKFMVGIAMTMWAFGESAGRARAAEALWREGYHEEAKRLMTENK